MQKSMDLLSRIAFAAASLVLMALSLMLVAFGAVGVIAGVMTSWGTPTPRFCLPSGTR